jgi:hypothetical protein
MKPGQAPRTRTTGSRRRAFGELRSLSGWHAFLIDCYSDCILPDLHASPCALPSDARCRVVAHLLGRRILVSTGTVTTVYPPELGRGLLMCEGSVIPTALAFTHAVGVDCQAFVVLPRDKVCVNLGGGQAERAQALYTLCNGRTCQTCAGLMHFSAHASPQPAVW